MASNYTNNTSYKNYNPSSDGHNINNNDQLFTTTTTSYTNTNESLFCRQERIMVTIAGDQLFSMFFSYAYFGSAIAGLITNSVVIYLIFETGQLRKKSIRLQGYLHMIDIFSSMVALMRGTLLVFADGVTCEMLRWAYFMVLLSIYASSYMFCLVSINRYLQITYLNEYEDKFNRTRLHICLIWYSVCVGVQATVGSVLNWAHYIGYASKYTTPFNVPEVVFSLFVYTLSAVKLKQYKSVNPSAAVTLERSIRYTFIYSMMFVLSQGYILTYQILMHSFALSSLQTVVLQNITILATSVSGWINAIFFLFTNDPSNNYIRRKMVLNNNMVQP